MLWKVILGLIGLILPNHPGTEPEYVPTPTGPQTREEADIASAALYGEFYGGDMKFPDERNETDAAIRNKWAHWPKNRNNQVVIPYVLDRSVMNIKDLIEKGIQQYHEHTCIRFVPRTNERDFIRVFYGKGCWSIIGRKGGLQDLSLGKGCAYIGLVVHEFGHAIGLYHEHQRSDRDKYVVIYPQNVAQGEMHNFQRTNPAEELIFTQYEYASIMHYGNYAFSKVRNKYITMEAKNGVRLYEPFEKPGFTESDIYMINKLYQC